MTALTELRAVLRGPCRIDRADGMARVTPLQFIAPRVTLAADCSFLVHFREPVAVSEGAAA